MKISILSILLLLTFAGLEAQKLNSKMVSENLKNKISSLYPGTSHVVWSKENGNIEAEFSNKGVATSVLLNSSAEVMEIETTISPAKLPAPVLKSIHAKFSNPKIKEAAIIETKGVRTFEAEIEGTDYMYSPEGKLVKSSKSN